VASGTTNDNNHHVHGNTRSTWASSNWSGYAETGTYTAIKGSWTVPSVTGPAPVVTTTVTRVHGRLVTRTTTTYTNTYSSAWIGIDGYSNSSLIQTGTEMDWVNGQAQYNAWWEVLPKAETPISKPVAPGDVLSASIVKSKNSSGQFVWTITISDAGNGTNSNQWSFTTSPAYSGPGTSAEWIVEAPTVGGKQATIADYNFPASAASAGDFNGAAVQASIGSNYVPAGLVLDEEGFLIQPVNGTQTQVSTPSAPNAAGTAFNISYGASAPAAPTA
jgi:hypothetical protein